MKRIEEKGGEKRGGRGQRDRKIEREERRKKIQVSVCVCFVSRYACCTTRMSRCLKVCVTESSAYVHDLQTDSCEVEPSELVHYHPAPADGRRKPCFTHKACLNDSTVVTQLSHFY